MFAITTSLIGRSPVVSPPSVGTAMTDDELRLELEQVLNRFGDLTSRKDLAILDEFATDGLIVGSEAHELACGRVELKDFFERFFAQSVNVDWEWRSIRVAAAGPLAWFFAEGEVVLTEAQNVQRLPYRMSGVLERKDGRWLWRQSHGSEPLTL